MGDPDNQSKTIKNDFKNELKENQDDDKFKIPKLSNKLSTNKITKLNSAQMRSFSYPSETPDTTNDTSSDAMLDQLNNTNSLTDLSPLTKMTDNQIKNLLKGEPAVDSSTKTNLTNKKTVNEGFSISPTNKLEDRTNLQNVNSLPVSKQQSESKQKRIKLIKKTTLVQDLENLNVQQINGTINNLTGLQQQITSEQTTNIADYDLGHVPIDIYTTNENETAEQIVEARGYLLQERIGSGAFANVYKAWQINDQFYTACKIIEIKKKKKKRLNDLKHELYVLSKMDHINIIKLYEHFLIDEKVYIFLEFASSGTLSEYVRKRGPLKETKARKWFKQICSGLYHMHSHGISHRDLKLGNILIDENRNCKITDFGLSRVSYRKGYGIFYCTSYCGTEPYMEPSILKKDEFGKRVYDPLAADIWALGVCLFAMLNKAYPFNPEDKELMIINQIERKWKFVKKQRNKLSNEVKDLVRHLLEPDPKRRITFLGIASHTWMIDSIDFDKAYHNSISIANQDASFVKMKNSLIDLNKKQ